jgi:hypothetical protein
LPTGVLSPVSAASSIERRGHEQAAVRRDLVAGLEGDDVARDELLGGDVDRRAAPARVRLDDQHLLQRGDGLGGLALLVQPEDRVQDGQAEDRDAGAELLERDHAHDRRPDQDELHQVAVLAQEGAPARLLLALGELVRPVLRASALDLGRLEPRPAVDVELRTGLDGRQVVPDGPVARWPGGRGLCGGGGQDASLLRTAPAGSAPMSSPR